MTQPQSSESLSEEPKTAIEGAEAEPEAAEPAPEPWTATRVIEWNAYYDLYVALGVLLLVFVASANEITHSQIWTWLRAGRIIAAEGKPLVTDLFSYTENGHRWVNISWLFQWVHALIFDGVLHAAPTNPADPLASAARHEQFAAAALVALTALVRTLTALLLLNIRRPGPGLWWVCITTTLALGAFLGPAGPALGGIAGTVMVAPDAWGTLFLAIELYLWHRTVDRGRPVTVWGLVPLFLLWANVDGSFFTGLAILTMGVIGQWGVRGENPLPPVRGLALLGACAAVCLANPSFYRIFPAAVSPLGQPFQISPLVARNVPAALGSVARMISLIYFTCVILGLGSFVLNRRRFSLSRFLMFLFMAILWGAYLPYRPEFATVFAVTLALNGQEWYLDRFGSEGRLERTWTAWSIGGRALTIVIVAAFVGMALTGWGKSVGDPIVGFGYRPEAFAFDMADDLRAARIQGRVLNTTREQGDALIWRAYPQRLTFIDSRSHLFSREVQDWLQKTRIALSKDDTAVWKPLLDQYKISAVVVDEPSSPNTYKRLRESPNWIPFYDDGLVVLFGRADAPASDLAYFRDHQLIAEQIAYHKPHPVPSPESTPLPMTWLDTIYRNRALREPQPHTTAALHWLQTQGTGDPSETGLLPDPAHCLLAIQEARIALSKRADDTAPYRILSEAYRILMLHETALLNGMKLTPANAEAILRLEPRTNLLKNRFRQRATALNAAILTSPLPRNDADRYALFTLNLQLFQLYMSVNYLDLARDRLQAMTATLPHDHDPQMASDLSQQLAALKQQVQQIADELNDMTIEQQLNPLQRAAFALSRGAPGLALVELEEAERTGISPTQVRPQLVDLYCDIGQPEKAQELINTGTLDDPSLETEPGVSAARQAKINFLLGFYDSAARLWQDRAIFKVRYDRTIRALAGATSLIHGQVKPAAATFFDIPTKISVQSSWEYDLGLCLLEGGQPDQAAGPLTESLTLTPDMAMRPIAAYYLEKLGKAVPPPSTPPAEAKETTKPKEPEKPDVTAPATPVDAQKPAEKPAESNEKKNP